MKIKDLKVDNIVELRNGEKYKVVYNEDFGLFVKETSGKKDYFDSNAYNNDLTNKIDNDYDIIKVTNRKNVILWTGNKETKNKSLINDETIDRLQEIMDMIDDFNLEDDEEAIRERNKCRSLFEELKGRHSSKNKIEKVKTRLRKYGINVNELEINDDGEFTSVSISGKGRPTKEQEEIMRKIITEEFGE